MKNNVFLIISAIAIGAIASSARADTRYPGYLVDSNDNIVKSNFGLCWRTGFWTPAMAVHECDPELVQKPSESVPETATEKPAAPAAPAGPVMPAQPPAKLGAAAVVLQAETLFDFDKALLRQEGKEALDGKIVAPMKDKPALKMALVIGHADRIGPAQYNQKLSERRAAAVKKYLVAKGIDAKRIQTEGKGQSQPVTKPGDCPGNRVTRKLIACLQPDRRVEVSVENAP